MMMMMILEVKERMSFKSNILFPIYRKFPGIFPYIFRGLCVSKIPGLEQVNF
jgi:hypothetical protein